MHKMQITKSKIAKKSLYKDSLLVTMVLCFISIAFTGAIKNRGLLNIFGITNQRLPMKQISIIHDWSGVALIILIISHLIIQRHWFGYISKKLLNFRKVVLFIVLGGLAAFATLSSIKKLNQSTVTTLQSVEITEYKGENLSSIADFRENSIKGPQYIDLEEYKLKIGGLVDNEKLLSYDEVLNYKNYSKVVTLYCVEGWSAKILWEGVLLRDLINDAKPKGEANTVIFYAYDGYSSSLPLDYVINNYILLAYKMNDVVLPPERGFPFQVVAEDKWGYKWVKWVTEIELSNDESFKGYWESAGYNQGGNVNGPKFE